MYAQVVSKNLISISSYQRFICSWYFEKSTIALKHKSPIHIFQNLFLIAGSTQRSKEKKQLFPSICNRIFGCPVKKSLEILIHSSDVWVAPTCGNPNSKRKWISNVKWQNYNPLNYKSYCEKSMGFPGQRWRPRDITIVKCGLVYFEQIITTWLNNTPSNRWTNYFVFLMTPIYTKFIQNQ